MLTHLPVHILDCIVAHLPTRSLPSFYDAVPSPFTHAPRRGPEPRAVLAFALTCRVMYAALVPLLWEHLDTATRMSGLRRMVLPNGQGALGAGNLSLSPSTGAFSVRGAPAPAHFVHALHLALAPLNAIGTYLTGESLENASPKTNNGVELAVSFSGDFLPHPDALRILLPRITGHMPALRVLHLSHFALPKDNPCALMDALTSIAPQLEELTIHPAGFPFGHAMDLSGTHLPQLMSLCIVLRTTVPVSAHDSVVPALVGLPVTPVLQTIRLIVPTLAPAVATGSLPALVPQLRSFDVHITHSPNARRLLCDAVCQVNQSGVPLDLTLYHVDGPSVALLGACAHRVVRLDLVPHADRVAKSHNPFPSYMWLPSLHRVRVHHAHDAGRLVRAVLAMAPALRTVFVTAASDVRRFSQSDDDNDGFVCRASVARPRSITANVRTVTSLFAHLDGMDSMDVKILVIE
ncbi:hypothetical protein BC828DRAFT_129012 [Blastocladiella britannica]|nr:hypothetical protein BC828DRAFT_129012 [Blastocladiella britannica]